jgi:hypothetical protein
MPLALRIRVEPGRVYFQCAKCQTETWQPAPRLLRSEHERIHQGRVQCERCCHWIDFDEENVISLAREAARLERARRTSTGNAPDPT